MSNLKVIGGIVVATTVLVFAGNAVDGSVLQLTASYADDVVDRVVDGDTIETKGFKKVNIRILGIDTPETKHPRKGVECGGPEATAFAQRELRPGTPVRLVPDLSQGDMDFTDRPLRYVEYYKDGRWVDFSTESARAGHADVYVYKNKPVLRDSQIRAAVGQAKAERIGRWAHC